MLAVNRIEVLISQIREYEERGGPEPHQYADLLAIFNAIGIERRTGEADLAVQDFIASSESFSTRDTMQGHVCQRPYGYNGDFEIIDRIYRRQESGRSQLTRWDRFFHSGDAANAVRARKEYCISQLVAHATRKEGNASILNIASGPCRDVLEFKSAPDPWAAAAKVHCIEQDRNAVQYARALTAAHASTVTFEERNVFRVPLPAAYDLVWCGGLFDYFGDRLFVALARKLIRACAPGGEVIIGNFSPRLESRHYMEFGGWELTYRDAHQLSKLAMQAGVPSGRIRIGQEPSGVNLFLHIGC